MKVSLAVGIDQEVWAELDRVSRARKVSMSFLVRGVLDEGMRSTWFIDLQKAKDPDRGAKASQPGPIVDAKGLLAPWD